MNIKERLQTLLETAQYFNVEIDKEQNIIIIEDDEVYFIPSGYTIKGTKYHYLIFEPEYATTWTSNVNVYHTNDNEFIDKFIEEKEVYC